MNTMKERWICPDMDVQVFTPQEYCEICEDEVTYKMVLYQHADAWIDSGTIIGEWDNQDLYVDNVNIPGHIHQYADPTRPNTYVLPEEIVIDMEMHDGWILFGKNPATGYASNEYYKAKVSEKYKCAAGLQEWERKEKNHS